MLKAGKINTRARAQHDMFQHCSILRLRQHEKKEIKERGETEYVCMLKRKPPWWDKQLLSVAGSVLQGWLRNHSVRKRADRYTGWVCWCEGDERLRLAHQLSYAHRHMQSDIHMNTLHRCRPKYAWKHDFTPCKVHVPYHSSVTLNQPKIRQCACAKHLCF